MFLIFRVPKNQRSVAYCTAIRRGGQEDWKFLWKKYLESNCASEQLVILKALGCSRDTTILEKYTNLIYSWEKCQALCLFLKLRNTNENSVFDQKNQNNNQNSDIEANFMTLAIQISLLKNKRLN